MQEYSLLSYSQLPTDSGVYVFLDDKNRVLYVGKAVNLKSRVASYFAKNAKLMARTKALVGKVRKIKVTIVESELEALLLEAFYIKKFEPYYNVRLSDDKSYIRIRITVKEDYPSVLLARSNPREKDDKQSAYFGPYTNSYAVRIVLKYIRKIFPYVSTLNHPKRICLYNHLGLCPCPPVFASPEYKKSYRKNIRGIINILEGKSRSILKDLEKQRDKFSKKEMYEEANILQKKIDALNHIIEPRHQPFEYDLNPNLRSDLRQNELKELKQVLTEASSGAWTDAKLQKLSRIECYDISNTQGVYATGSMIVFTNGERNSREYRRFKIKKDGKPNDFAMMEEVLSRRFRRKGWDLPDLIIVDGGRGQVSSGLKALAVNNINIPLMGLAKRKETIIVPRVSGAFENFSEVSLPKNSPALHLIMRIRDEAHRFAITYHRLLRSKNAFN